VRSFIIGAAVAIPLLGSRTDGPRADDPAQNLARVRLLVATTAATTDVTVSGASIASYISAVLDGPDGTRASRTGATLRMSNPAAGRRAEARFDIVLAGVRAGGSLTWNLTTDRAAEAQLEVSSANDLDKPRLVDRFESHDSTAHFTTDAALLAAHGHLRIASGPHLLPAHHYPWYTL